MQWLYDCILGCYRAPCPGVCSGRSDGRLAVTGFCQNHGTPGLPELLYDNHWYLVCACWDSFAYPAFSSPQGVGLCRPDLSLHGSDCIPSSSGDPAVTLVGLVIL